MTKRLLWIPAIFALDRVTKILSFSLPAEGQELLPGLVRLRFCRNTGMAFSLLSGHAWVLGVFSVLVLLGAWFFLRKKQLHPLTETGVMLMAGGCLGNLPDRFFLGYVPDFIELEFVNFAVFNVADMALTIGCALILLHLLTEKTPSEQAKDRVSKPVGRETRQEVRQDV